MGLFRPMEPTARFRSRLVNIIGHCSLGRGRRYNPAMNDTVPTDAETPKLLCPAPGIYVRQEVDNITWIDMGDHLIVVDALEVAGLEDEVMGLIASTTGGKPVRYLLNTHTHYDHVVLNEAFARRGAQIVNQVVSPLPADGRWFDGARRRVLMLPMGGAHTEEDCIVHVPDAGVLLAGDICGWGVIPLVINLRASTARTLVATYRRLIDFNADVIIPGHGPLATTADLRRWIDYFHAIIRKAKSKVSSGLSDEQIKADLAQPPADMTHWWRLLKWKHQDTVAKVIKSVRRGFLDDYDLER